MCHLMYLIQLVQQHMYYRCDGTNNQFLKTNGSGTLSWGGLTVQEMDDNPTINNVSTIKFDSSTGLEVTDLVQMQ